MSFSFSRSFKKVTGVDLKKNAWTKGAYGMAAISYGGGLGIKSGVENIGGAYKELSGYDDLKDAEAMTRRLGDMNASFIGQESDEAIRRLESTHKQNIGTAKATVGASGVSMEGSNQGYLNEMESQFQGEKSWMKKASISKQHIAKLEAATQAKVSQANRKSNVLGDASSVLSFF